MKKFNKISQILLFIAGLFILSAIILPIWRMDLQAPQYPEGLFLQIYSYKMGGDVQIINGLNHYIGMKEIKSDEFVEFAILPYCFGFFGIFSIFAAFAKNRKLVLALLISLLLFGILSMLDFWLWEYDYGHNLNPNAAIIVPGMAYQPPLIGFKQLLNFGALSLPDLGGILVTLGGLLVAFVYAFEAGWLSKIFQKKSNVAVLLLLFLFSCSESGPEPIKLNKDNCAYCKMTITDGHFANEIITEKGRVYKFDDLSCLFRYKIENKDKIFAKNYVCNFLTSGELIPCETAFYIKGAEIKSPMNGNIAAFKSESDMQTYQAKFNAEKITWEELNK